MDAGLHMKRCKQSPFPWEKQSKNFYLGCYFRFKQGMTLGYVIKFIQYKPPLLM